MRCGLAAGIVALGVICLTGCGKPANPNGVETTPVTVRVTHKGQALPGAIVTFVAEGGSYSSHGVTDAGGKAVMGTFGDNDGVVPGKYRVTVRKIQVGESSAASDAADPGPTAVKSLIPEHYSQASKSGLTATIAPGAPQEVELSLSDSVPPNP
jgi:hypothetical protein